MSDLSFEAAARELGVSPKELEKLVAAGKISAIKSGDTLQFKRAAIDGYKSQRGDDADILLSDEEIDLLGDDEIDFGIDIDGGDAELEATPKAVGGAKKVPALSIDDDLPEIDLGGDLDIGGDELDGDELDGDELDLGGGGGGDDTVLDLEDMLEGDSEATTPIPAGDLGDETLLDTDLLDLGDDDADTFELDTTEDTLLDPTEEGSLLRGGGARVMQMKKRKSHAGWTAVLALAGLLMLAPLAVLLSTVYLEDLRVGAIEKDKGRAQHEWIQTYGGAFRGAVGAFADVFRKKS